MATYFAPKCVLVLSGANLDGKLKLVYEKRLAEAAHHPEAPADHTVRDTYLKVMPSTPKDCQDLIALLQERVLAINMKGAMSSHSSLSGSRSVVVSENEGTSKPQEVTLLSSVSTKEAMQVVPI